MPENPWTTTKGGPRLGKIRMLYTIPNFDTAGSGRLLLSIMNRMDRSLFDLQICCFHTQGTFFATVENSGFPVHVYNFVANMSNRLKGLRQVWNIARFFRSLNVDIIHSFHYAADYSEALAARLAGCKWVYTKKNMSWHGKSHNGWKLRTLLANGVIAQNSEMVSMFFSNHRKVVMIPSAVDTEAFAPERLDMTLREQFQTPIDSRILITVANLVPVKGIEILIDAFSKIVSQHPAWMLWIVGDNSGDYGQFLEQQCRIKGISEKTRFVGRQDDVRRFLDQAEIFIIPTLNEGRREGSPVALLEAMANEKVVFASAVPGITDQLREFTDHLFTAGNAEELARKLSHWMALDKDQIRQRGREFRKHATKNYSIELIAAQHAEFYQRML